MSIERRAPVPLGEAGRAEERISTQPASRTAAPPADRGLYSIMAACPRCGSRAQLRVTRTLAEALRTQKPGAVMAAYTCPRRDCGATYDLSADAILRSVPPAGPAAAEESQAAASEPAGDTPPADAFAILGELAASVEGPSDWAAEHDHYLYGTSRRGAPQV